MAGTDQWRCVGPECGNYQALVADFGYTPQEAEDDCTANGGGLMPAGWLPGMEIGGKLGIQCWGGAQLCAEARALRQAQASNAFRNSGNSTDDNDGRGGEN